MTGKELISYILQAIEIYKNETNKTPNKLIISKTDYNKLKDELINPFTVFDYKQNSILKLMGLDVEFKPILKPVVYFKPKYFGLTVGQLKSYLNNYDDDYPVYIERVEDVYFEKHGWQVTTFEFKDGEKTTGVEATGTGVSNDKVIIFAHY